MSVNLVFLVHSAIHALKLSSCIYKILLIYMYGAIYIYLARLKLQLFVIFFIIQALKSIR